LSEPAIKPQGHIGIRPDKDTFLAEENPFEAMMERFDHVFALDVRGRGDVRGDDRLTAIEPFDDLMSSGMDLYDLFIDRRAWPDRMLSGYKAARDALTPFTRQPARRRSSGRKAAGS